MRSLMRFSAGAGLLFFVLLIVVAMTPPHVTAQELRVGEVVSLYTITDSDVTFGDIIIFDPAVGTYQRARTVGDSNMFGVAIENPVLIYRTDTATDTIPVIGEGEVVVNVTTLNGPIQVGDLVTSSPVAGKGQRADENAQYVLGTAQESFSFGNGSTTTVSGQEIAVGDVVVRLHIGPNPDVKAGVAGVTEATILNIIQYVVAAFVTVGSIFIAFRNFGPNLREGVASIGRNPLARASIQSMVIFNAVLIVLISLAGLFIGVAIIMLPI